MNENFELFNYRPKIFGFILLIMLPVKGDICYYYPNYPLSHSNSYTVCPDICCATRFPTTSSDACCSNDSTSNYESFAFKWWWLLAPALTCSLLMIIAYVFYIFMYSKKKAFSNQVHPVPCSTENPIQTITPFSSTAYNSYQTQGYICENDLPSYTDYTLKSKNNLATGKMGSI